MIDSTFSALESATEGNEPEAHYYFIDTGSYEVSDVDFDEVVQSRMCDACRARKGTEVEERTMSLDPDSGKPRWETQRALYGSDPIKVIQEHCGKTRTYINRDMPTLEAVFRILLANGNVPMTLPQVREQLHEWCPGGGCQWLLLPLETVERLVDFDRSYGLRVTEPPADALV